MTDTTESGTITIVVFAKGGYEMLGSTEATPNVSIVDLYPAVRSEAARISIKIDNNAIYTGTYSVVDNELTWNWKATPNYKGND